MMDEGARFAFYLYWTEFTLFSSAIFNSVTVYSSHEEQFRQTGSYKQKYMFYSLLVIRRL